MSSRTPYRPDIDGLRALAVAAVALFHVFPKQMPGGFIGVDIFFVISGFLISTLLLREMQDGSYRYSAFLGRRVRRIFPALGVVLGASLLVGWALLSAQEFKALGKEITAGSLFYANIFFWNQSGYFDTASEFKPLLHLWSLGVEEQFYLLYPPLLLLLYRRRWKLAHVLAALALLSFVISYRATGNGFAFYMLPARFWELLCGAFVAFLMARERPIPTGRRQFLSWAGIILIFVALGYAREEAFPGYWVLLPTVGAGLFILAGPAAFLNRHLFSLRPAVALGLVSYPLYLWHWPLLSFGYILGGGTLKASYRLLALGVSLVLATLTYLAVEQPARRLPFPRACRLLLPVSATAAAAGLLIVFANGFPQRHAVEVANDGETDNVVFYGYVNAKFLPCEAHELRESAPQYQGILRCYQSRPGTQYDLILVGDSHAEHLFYGLASRLPAKNVLFAVSRGMPLLGNTSYREIFDYLLHSASSGRARIVFTAAWFLHFEDSGMFPGLEASVQAFQHAGYRVYLTDDIPAFPFEPSLCKIRRRINLEPPTCRLVSAEMDRERSLVQLGIAKISAATGAPVLRTHDFFHDEGGYFMAKDGQLFYRDGQHLTINGSLYLAKRLQMDGQLQGLAGMR